jgi:hypothetical protein
MTQPRALNITCFNFTFLSIYMLNYKIGKGCESHISVETRRGENIVYVLYINCSMNVTIGTMMP